MRRGVPADGVVRFPFVAAGDYVLWFRGEQIPVTVPYNGRFRIR